MIDSYGILLVQCNASPEFPPDSRACCGGFSPTLFFTQDVRLTGLYKDMHPGGFLAFLRGKMMAIFQIWGDFPVEKLRLKISCSSCLTLGPRTLRNVGGISSGPGAPLALLRRRMRRRRFISCAWKEGTDSSTASLNACHRLRRPGGPFAGVQNRACP